MVDNGEEVPKGGHLIFGKDQFLAVLKDPKILLQLSAQQEELVGAGNKGNRKMQGEFLDLIPCVDLPFLTGNTESADTRTPELKPVAVLV
jgi:hypothetical protein